MSDTLLFAPLTNSGVAAREDSSQTAWLFPGLGCRYIGMGNDLFERNGKHRDYIAAAEEFLGYRLAPVCLEGSGRKIVPARQEAQIIYVLNCAYAVALFERGNRPSAVLGHSLGSWAACWTTGAFDFLTGLELITQVEQWLEEIVDSRDLSMGAIIGLNEAAICKELADYPDAFVANFNSPAQFVIGGSASDVDAILKSAEKRGAKQAKRLPTSRAMHTPWLKEVAARLQRRLDLVEFSDPKACVIAGDCAEELRTGDEIRKFFSVFLMRPVQWERSFLRLCTMRASRFLEVGPGVLLKTLASFIDPAAAVQSAADYLNSTS